MSEAVKPSDVPPEEQKGEGEIQFEMAQEKNTTETSDTEPKKADNAIAKALERPEGTEIKTEKEATPSTTQEVTAAMESDAGKILNAGPSIKIEAGTFGDNAGDTEDKEAKRDPVQLDKEMPTESISEGSAVPALSKGSTDENTLVPNEKVENIIRTDTSGADIESSKVEEELKGTGAPSSHVELSGSTTETTCMDTASSDPAPSSVESTTAVRANSEIQTDVVPISDVKEQTLSTAETTIGHEIKKESGLITDTQRVTSEDSAFNRSDKMEIDIESKSVTDISQKNVQKEETLAQGNVQKTNIPSDVQKTNIPSDVQKTNIPSDVQKTNIPSDVGVQNRETHDADGGQKPETASLHSYIQQKESVTMDITQKNQNKAVHEIIAEQSSRLDREMIVPTPVPLDRQSLVQSSVPPAEEDLPTSVPSAVQTPVPAPVPTEKESVGSILVPAERAEPVAQPDLAVPVTTDPKTEVQESLDDWDIPATDDEEDDGENQAGDGIEKKKRKVVKRGYWEPPIDVIVDLYNKLDKDGILELSWKCPGRRPPSEEGDKEEEKEELEDVQDEEAMEISQEEDPTEFDFDMDIELDSSVQKKMTPRRAIGGGQAQGSGKKRVARMDKVLNDIFRHRKIDTSLTDTDKKDGEGKESDQAMDTTISPILALNRPSDKFHIRSDLNM